MKAAMAINNAAAREGRRPVISKRKSKAMAKTTENIHRSLEPKKTFVPSKVEIGKRLKRTK